MTVTQKEIDTNGNGYVDGNEAQKAKEKGVKNVWNNMTEQDYNNDRTRDDKLRQLYNDNNYNNSKCNNEDILLSNIIKNYKRNEKYKNYCQYIITHMSY